jgi:hypothetical protein
MNRKILGLIILLLFINGTILSNDNQFYIDKPGKWIENVAFDREINYTDEDIDNGCVYILVDFQTNISTKEKYKHYAIKIVNETGIESNSDIWINYDPGYQKLRFHKLVIIRNGEIHNKLDRSKFKIIQNESELNRKIYNETYSAGLFIEDLRAGDILEYSYTIEGINPIFNGNFFDFFYLQYSIPIKKLYAAIYHSKDIVLYHKLFNSDHTPQVTNTKDYSILKWEIDNAKEVITQSYENLRLR